MSPIDPDALARALAFAARAHAGQKRKGTEVPYLSHLLAVAALVVEHGGDTDQAIAALLHDSIEDCEGVTAESLAEAFGARVARIVADCTDTGPGDRPGAKSPWKERKLRYLDHLASALPESLLVSACDKRHNLADLVRDVRSQGKGYLSRFSASPAEQVWYFEGVLKRVRDRVPPRLAREIEELAQEFRSLVGGR
ncbi:MAG: HD domain-containing protein [Planctomycetes bacterium]|nr:HD domain-containing protein [Planctomycetota bacterium]